MEASAERHNTYTSVKPAHNLPFIRTSRPDWCWNWISKHQRFIVILAIFGGAIIDAVPWQTLCLWTALRLLTSDNLPSSTYTPFPDWLTVHNSGKIPFLDFIIQFASAAKLSRNLKDCTQHPSITPFEIGDHNPDTILRNKPSQSHPKLLSLQTFHCQTKSHIPSGET